MILLKNEPNLFGKGVSLPSEILSLLNTAWVLPSKFGKLLSCTIGIQLIFIQFLRQPEYRPYDLGEKTLKVAPLLPTQTPKCGKFHIFFNFFYCTLPELNG